MFGTQPVFGTPQPQPQTQGFFSTPQSQPQPVTNPFAVFPPQQPQQGTIFGQPQPQQTGFFQGQGQNQTVATFNHNPFQLTPQQQQQAAFQQQQAEFQQQQQAAFQQQQQTIFQQPQLQPIFQQAPLQQQQPTFVYQIQPQPIFVAPPPMSLPIVNTYHPPPAEPVSVGRMASIFTTDSTYMSPFFEWKRNPATGDMVATNLNPSLVSSFLLSPGERVLDNMRRFRNLSTEELEFELEREKALDQNSNRRPFLSQIPKPVGLFEQPRSLRAIEYQSHSPIQKPSASGDFRDPWKARITEIDHDESSSSSAGKYKKMRPLSAKPYITTYCDTRNDSSVSLTRSSSYLNPSKLPFLAHSVKGFRPGRESSPISVWTRSPRPLDSNSRTVNSTSSSSLNQGQSHGQTCRVQMTQPSTYCKPGLDALDQMTKDGRCLVKDFAVGHKDYGEIIFPGQVDVYGLNLDKTISFAHKEVELYKGGWHPPFGQGLNRPCIVTLYKIWPKDPLTGDPVSSVSALRTMNYESILTKACSRFGGKFVSYNPWSGQWTFQIQNPCGDHASQN